MARAPAWRLGPPGPFIEPAFEPGGARVSPQAVASFVLGALSLPSCCCSFIGSPMAIAAIVLGFVSLASIRRDPSAWRGSALAVLGIVVGSIGLLLQLVAFFLMFDDALTARYFGSYF